MSDPPKQRSEADAELQREILRERKFTLIFANVRFFIERIEWFITQEKTPVRQYSGRPRDPQHRYYGRRRAWAFCAPLSRPRHRARRGESPPAAARNRHGNRRCSGGLLALQPARR